VAARTIVIYEPEYFFHSSALLILVLVSWQQGFIKYSVNLVNIPAVVWPFFHIIVHFEALLPSRPDIFCFAFCVVFLSFCVGTDKMLAEVPSLSQKVLALIGFLCSRHAPACWLCLSYSASLEC